MLDSGKGILEKAKLGGYCIPQFNVNNLEWAKTILEVANNLKTPVILGVSEGAIDYMGGYNTVVGMVNGLIEDLNIIIPVVLHLDHGSSIESCKKAIDSGFSSVMIDASSFNIEKNIEITSKVVEYAHLRGVSVEGELGCLGSSEEGQKKAMAHTDVDKALRYIKETGIDSFAPAIGNKHGIYNGEPNLNIDLLKKLHMKINIPLVLHGGSGLSDEMLLEVIKNGITKININTELQVEWAKEVRAYLIKDKKAYDPRKIIGAGKNAIGDAITKKINLLNGKASG